MTDNPLPAKTSAKSVAPVYAELGSEIRHYSTIRSSLTVFLITVSLTAFAGYLGTGPSAGGSHSPYLAIAGFIFSLAAPIVCLFFSYKTEKAAIRYLIARRLLLKGGSDTEVHDEAIFLKDTKKIWARVGIDAMNYVLIIGDALLVIVFCWRNLLRWQ